jgi:hypothetical protein
MADLPSDADAQLAGLYGPHALPMPDECVPSSTAATASAAVQASTRAGPAGPALHSTASQQARPPARRRPAGRLENAAVATAELVVEALLALLEARAEGVTPTADDPAVTACGDALITLEMVMRGDGDAGLERARIAMEQSAGAGVAQLVLDAIDHARDPRGWWRRRHGGQARDPID